LKLAGHFEYRNDTSSASNTFEQAHGAVPTAVRRANAVAGRARERDAPALSWNVLRF
jgi:hypothetical protein